MNQRRFSRTGRWPRPGLLTCAFVLAAGSASGDIGLRIDKRCLIGGDAATGTVNVPPADFPRDPLTGRLLPVRVELSSSSTRVTLPSTLFVTPNNRSATFELSTAARCTPPCPPTDATITASLGGRNQSQEIVTLLRNVGEGFESLELDPREVTGGAISIATVSLRCPAPPAGLSVSVTSNDPAAAPLESPVTIAPDETTVEIPITTSVVSSRTEVTISAAVGGVLRRATLTILPGSFDLALRKIEVTQGIQFLDDTHGEPDNSIPLYRGRPTAVRVFLESDSPNEIRHIPVALWSRVCGGGEDEWIRHLPMWPSARILPGLSIEEQRESPQSVGAQDRAMNATFLLDPEDLERGCLDFRAEVNPPQIGLPKEGDDSSRLFEESDYTNNTVDAKTLRFREGPVLQVKFVRVDYCTGCPFDEDSRFKPPWSDIYPLISYLEKTFPVERVRYLRSSKEVNITRFSPFKDLGRERTWVWILTKLAVLRAFTDDEPPWIHYYGMLDRDVPRQTAGGPLGLAWIPPIAPPISAGIVGKDRSPTIAAQEIAHNMGREHAPCRRISGVPPDLDANWPEATNRHGIIGHTGFDVDLGIALKGRAVPPDLPDNQIAQDGSIYKDFMSYCTPAWVSPYTYRELGIRIPLAPQPGPLAGDGALAGEEALAGAGAGADDCDSIIIRGVVEDGGKVTLGSFYRRSLPCTLSDFEGTGPMSIVLRSSDGATLFRRRFDPRIYEEAGAIAETLPYDEATARIDIIETGIAGDIAEDILLASRVVSARAPEVEITSPLSGTTLAADERIVLEWDAIDADGDELEFLVQFSVDGGESWEAIAVDLREPRLELGGDELPGTDAALLRVIASDGILSGEDILDAPFSIETKGPDASILSPAQGAVFTEGTAFLLRGAAYDIEDGGLLDESLSWNSSLDGLLGEGRIVLATLSVGAHALTLDALDGDGNKGSATVVVSVLPADPDETVGARTPSDCNGDGNLDISDGVCLLGFLFQGQPTRLPCGDGNVEHPGNVQLVDANGDGAVDISDAVWILGYLFTGGPEPLLGTECIDIPGCSTVCDE